MIVLFFFCCAYPHDMARPQGIDTIITQAELHIIPVTYIDYSSLLLPV